MKSIKYHFLEHVLLHTHVNFFRLFVWEARRLLSAEASKADASRHYGFYIDGDIAKLPGGKFEKKNDILKVSKIQNTSLIYYNNRRTKARCNIM